MATSAAKLKWRVPAWLAAVAALSALLAFGAGGAAVDAGTDPFAPQAEFLPVRDAFVFSAHVQRAPERRLIARWTMPDGYYLYRSKFAVALESASGAAPAPLALPDGVDKVDRYFGASEVYYGSVELSVPLAGGDAAPAAARISFQGCAEAGLCYPPQNRRVVFDSATGQPIMQ